MKPLAALLLLASFVSASDLKFNHVIRNPEAAHHQFGASMRFFTSGHVGLAIGSPSTDASAQGSVHFYAWNNTDKSWEMWKKLTGPSSFGSDIAVNTDDAFLVAVGAPDVKRVDLFKWNKTIGEFQLLKSVHGTNARFGHKVSLTKQWLIVADPESTHQCAHSTQPGTLLLYRAPQYDTPRVLALPCSLNDPEARLGETNIESRQLRDYLDVHTGVPGRNGGQGAVFSMHREWSNDENKLAVEATKETKPPVGSKPGFGASIRALDSFSMLVGSTHPQSLVVESSGSHLFTGRPGAYLNRYTFLTCDATAGQCHVNTLDYDRLVSHGSLTPDTAAGHPAPTAHFGGAADSVQGRGVVGVADAGAGCVYVSVPEITERWPLGTALTLPVYHDQAVGDVNPGRLGLTCPRCYDVFTRAFILNSPKTHYQAFSGYSITPYHDFYPSPKIGLPRNITYSVMYEDVTGSLAELPYRVTLQRQDAPFVEGVRIDEDTMGIDLLFGKVNVTWTPPATPRDVWVCLATHNNKHIHAGSCVQTPSTKGRLAIPVRPDLEHCRILMDSYGAVVIDPHAPAHAFRASFSENNRRFDIPSLSLGAAASVTVGGHFDFTIRCPEEVPLADRYVRIAIENPMLGYVKVLQERARIPGRIVMNVTEDCPQPPHGNYDYKVVFRYATYPGLIARKLPYGLCKAENSSVRIISGIGSMVTRWEYSCTQEMLSNLYLIDAKGHRTQLLHNELTASYRLEPGTKYATGLYTFRWESTLYPDKYHATSAVFQILVIKPKSSMWVVWPVIGGTVLLALLGITIVGLGHYWRKRRAAQKTGEYEKVCQSLYHDRV